MVRTRIARKRFGLTKAKSVLSFENVGEVLHDLIISVDLLPCPNMFHSGLKCWRMISENVVANGDIGQVEWKSSGGVASTHFVSCGVYSYWLIIWGTTKGEQLHYV